MKGEGRGRVGGMGLRKSEVDVVVYQMVSVMTFIVSLTGNTKSSNLVRFANMQLK